MSTKRKKNALARTELDGNFVRAIAREGRLLDGVDFKAWALPLRKDHYPNEEFVWKIYYEVKSPLPTPIVEHVGLGGASAPPEVSFVYLDVGAWIGSPEGKWGSDDDGKGRYLKRDFGIVCGPLVALCSFSCAYTKGHCEAWKKANKSRDPFASVAALIDALSKKAEDDGLGHAVVRDVVTAPYSSEVQGDRDHILVIVGDMHVPVLDELEQTYQMEKAGSPPKWVRRLGRVDLPPLESVVKQNVGPSADGTRFVLHLFETYERPGGTFGAALEGSPILEKAAKEIVKPINDEHGVRNGLMDSEQAKRWWQYYREGVDGGKPADIFECAGADFHEFARRLAVYAEAAASQELIPVVFRQLGDMLDFWVGFGCHYDPAPHDNFPVVVETYEGFRMVKDWTVNMLGRTQQGKHVARAIEKIGESMAPIYLYGNHDNYLGYLNGLKYPPEGGGRYVNLQPRRGFHEDPGVFMEHGHQWDDSNADTKSKLPVERITGTPAPMGQLVTQAAFIRPAPIRLIEGPASAAAAGARGRGQRLEQIVGAVNRFVSSGYGFYCYVMGHTHCACLSRVAITQADPSNEKASKRIDPSKTAKISVTVNGAPYDKVGYIARGGAETGAEWEGIPVFSDEASVALEDKYSKPRGFDRAVKGRAVRVAQRADDRAKISGLPAGAYVARYYLTLDANEYFIESYNALVVLGLSLEGDPDHAEGLDFEYDEVNRKFDKELVLRWGFRPEDFDPRCSWCGLYRPSERDDHLSASDLGNPLAAILGPMKGTERTHHFQHVYGKCKLADIFTVPWGKPSEMGGEWQVRAFTDLGGERRERKKLGQVEFVVKVVKNEKRSRRRR
jgi:hypothetical protein